MRHVKGRTYGEHRERCVMLAEYLIEHQCTVRCAAHYFAVSKSTVHKDVSVRLRDIDHVLYERVKAVLEQNKSERHLRGGEATRRKYLRLHTLDISDQAKDI